MKPLLTTLFLVGLFFVVPQSTFAAPIVAGSFSTTWDGGDSSVIQINLGACPSSVYWEEIGNESNNGTSTVCTGGFDQTITFPYAGRYRVDFSGSFTTINLGIIANRDKFRTVEQWGDSAWTTLNVAFSSVSDLAINASDAPDLSGVTSLESMFSFTDNFNSDISHWNVSTITDFRTMFRQAQSFNQPLDTWDVSNATQMRWMFWDAVSFNQPLNTWNVSGVTDFGGTAPYFDNGMFSGATSFNQPLDNWNITAATSLRGMFAGATAFNQSLNAWDFSLVTDMRQMFSGATAFNQSLGNLSLADGVRLQNVLNNSGIDTTNYTATLIGWGGRNLMPSDGQEDIGSVPATYCDTAQASRDVLTTNSWTITDLGSVPCVVESSQTTSDSSGTKVGLRNERIDALRESMSVASSTPAAGSVERFVASLRKILDYLTNNEEELNNLTPQEARQLIVVLRDAVVELLKLLPGI